MTNREKVLAILRRSPHPLDDDELARRAGIRPRQTVNRICRELADEGLLHRVDGPDGKIVNELRLSDEEQPSAGKIAVAPRGARLESEEPLPPGDSSEQRMAERAALDALGQRLGLSLNPRRIELPEGIRVEIDGADAALSVLVECWAHQGPAKVAQKYKLVNDAVKLHWVATKLPGTPRLILCVTDEEAVRHLRGRSWQAAAIQELGVRIEVVALSEQMRESILQAQQRQFR